MTEGPAQNPRKILSFDTSSSHCSISISEDTHIQIEYNFISENNLVTSLVPAMEFVLKSLNLSFEELDAFAVGIGPGLFTGIRIGLATLKGLNLQLKKPVVPILTLEATAYKYQDTKSILIPLINARRGEIYMAGYQLSEGDLKEIIAPDLITLEDLPLKLSPFKSFKFVGSDCREYRSFLQDNFPEIKQRHRSSFLATELSKLAHNRLKKKDYITDLQKLEPFYLRKPDAETTQKPLARNNKGRPSG